MKLLRLHVDRFGCLEDFRWELNDGFNVLYRENGWGKSTLAVFIKAMFFGLPASSKRSLEENERKKYTPWQGGTFGGSLEFSCRAGAFRIERSFAAKESGDTFALFDLTTNKPSDRFDAEIGTELLGIDADGFERSTYLSQRNCAEKCNSGSISARLTALLSKVDDADTYDRALELLDKRRKFYILTGNRGAVADAERSVRETDAELERCKEAATRADQLREELRMCAQQIQNAESDAHRTKEALKQAALQREYSAHTENRARMEEDLSILNRKKNELEQRFHGPIPTDDECRSAQDLYDQCRDAYARRRSVSAPFSGSEALADLQKRFPNGVPSEETWHRWETKNQAIRELNTKKEALAIQLQHLTGSLRLTGGIPTEEQFRRADEHLGHSERLKAEIQQLQAQQAACSRERPTHRIEKIGTLIGSVLLLLAALAALSVSAPFPAVCSLFVACGCCVLMTVLLWISSAKQTRIQKEQVRSLQRQAEAKEAERTALLSELRSFLTRFGIDTGADLASSLAEWKGLARQYQAVNRQRSRINADIEQLRQQIEPLCVSLQAELSVYLGAVPQRSDYRSDLDRLRRTAERLSDLEAEAHRREENCRRADAEYSRLQKELLPFFKRYSVETGSQGDCLHAITADAAEYRRLSHEITQKSAELRTFIQEKKLDDRKPSGQAQDADTLHRLQERQEREIQALIGKQTRLKEQWERVATEADRLEELEAEKQRRIKQWQEYQDNSRILAETAEFLKDAKSALSTRYLAEMQESFSRMLALVTAENAPEATLDTSFEVRLRQGGKTHSMESFSRGWQDTVRFCLHLALSEALFPEDEKPFLILDDPFVNLDEQHLAGAKKMLTLLAADRQILYFVCHKGRS